MVPALSSWLIFGPEGRAVTFLCGPIFVTVAHCTWCPLGGTFCPRHASGQCVYWAMWADAELKRQFLIHFLCSKFPNPNGFLTHASLSVLISICPANIDPAALSRKYRDRGGPFPFRGRPAPGGHEYILTHGDRNAPAACAVWWEEAGWGPFCQAQGCRAGLGQGSHSALQPVAGLHTPGQGLHLHPSQVPVGSPRALRAPDRAHQPITSSWHQACDQSGRWNCVKAGSNAAADRRGELANRACGAL